MFSNNKPKVAIIGAGMSGLGAAIKLLESGYSCVILESQAEAGGLAGSFSIDKKYFPFGYHHILCQDKPLLKTLKKLGLYPQVAWKKGKVLFAVDNQIYNLENPWEFIKFPMSWKAKIKFAKLMAYCFLKKDWEKSLGNAQNWLDKIAGEEVRKTIFDPLMDIKYGLPSENLSANWLGSRLHYQEFSKPLGYLPNQDWTKVLTDKMAEKVKELGGEIITNAPVTKIRFNQNKVTGLTYVRQNQSYDINTEIVINTAPPHIFLSLCDYQDTKLQKVEYLDALSLILETEQKLPRELYLLSCLRPRYSFGGIFMLSSLNRTIGVKNGTIVNFFTTLSPKYEYLRSQNSEELLETYQRDFEKIFGFRLEPIWHHLTLIKNYSPKFLNDYKNPETRGNIPGLYFAGNYLTYPIITSTGSAIASGEKAADYIIQDHDGH
ncbi:MAG: FAD-dependent oxidoreductase [bacterium]|nr:FAD-dependent oxidoreductase [bacterium]